MQHCSYAVSTLFPTAGTNLQQSLAIQPSLSPVNSEFTEMGQLRTYHLQLQIRDDSVGLEDPENRTLSLLALSHHCYDVQFTPYGQTQVIVLDDDSMQVLHQPSLSISHDSL